MWFFFSRYSDQISPSQSGKNIFDVSVQVISKTEMSDTKEIDIRYNIHLRYSLNILRIFTTCQSLM